MIPLTTSQELKLATSPYELTSDQRDLVEVVRRIATERVAGRADDIDRTGEYPQDMFDLLRDADLFGLAIPQEFGGAGSLLSGCLAVEELGRVCYNTAYLLLLQWTPVGAIEAGGTDDQKAHYLPELAAGRLKAAFSLTEPQSGSDVSGIRTTATPDGHGGYYIDGAKAWCSNAAVADFILLAARVQDDESRSGINFFIVDTDSKGLEIGAPESKLGARGIPSSPLYLDRVHVPSSHVFKEGPDGFKTVMQALNASRPIIAARGVGLAQGALDHSVRFIQDRRAFGKTVADFQGIRWMIADMEASIEAARLLTYRAAAQVDAGVSPSVLAPSAAVAKLVSSDAAMKVATDAVQLFGAAGISNENPIGRYLRDAKVLQIIEGTNQIQRNIISKHILGASERTK